ncbi:dna double-strand break repair rad50 atpase [Cystoisospora suis]|uniref:Dna double-strand break repair rad50 atpase n=1 Tax=Cystoisospora suis TaxID=483139 RepID=A0A2C6KHJ2_9APIC|nr:dna double-strand break repair rad50 atpase [Cystoisospora suis]
MNPARVISSFSPSSLSSSSLSYGLSSDFSSSSLRCLSLFSVYFSYSFPCRSVTTHSSALGRPFHTLRLIVSESSFRCRSSSPFPCVKDHAFLDNAVSRESGAGRSYVHTASRQQTKDTSKPDAKKEKEEKDSSLFSSRYANLRKEDRDKLIAQKMMAGGKKRSEGNPIIPWEEFRSEDLDTPLREFQVHAREMETRKAKRLREQEREKPAFLRRRIFKAKRLTQGAEDDHDTEQHITAANFSEETHMLSLVEDLHKAELYCQTTDKLSRQWSTPGGVAKGILGDQFFDVMASALREDLQDQSRPVLVNELTDFENPYMMKREALKRILLHSCTRNCLDESLVDQFLDRRPELVKLRSEARLPPEAIEPLAAFVGVTRFSFDRRRRLEQKLEAVKQLLDHLPGQSEQQGKHDENTGTRPPLDDEAIEEVLRVLPENYPSDELHPAHPFRNHFGFESSVPVGVVGSISMGRGQKKLERELGQLRYPTLQRVAHSLPKDPKYRESVAHAIKILERSRGWDFESKIKAVNSLVEVWNNLAPGKTYERILEHAFPVFRGRGTVKKTRPRSVVFNKGLKYIRSLTTQKPLYVRLKGK